MDGEVARQAGPDEQVAHGPESLACVTCRTRKLKCGRERPICSRCARVDGQCVYPESRRRPTFKRKNVKELEERLAQVEGLLRDGMPRNGVQDDLFTLDEPQLHVAGLDDEPAGSNEDAFAREDGAGNDRSSHEGPIPTRTPGASSSFYTSTPFTGAAPLAGELMGLGQSERLPPVEMMEELNNVYFQRHHHFMPIIHPGRYIQSFYSAPLKRPPMCLQYAVWTMASNGHERYASYHDIFYKRARQYADADEMRGYGEHFISIPHAQAWALISLDEARSMLFTRAAMSSARCVRLVEMMGLHRLDGDGHEMAPTVAPPRDWTDLEERRRAFWGIFSIDCHASISTGWPTLIDPSDITTNLPSSEEAFNEFREESTPSLPEAFKGEPYSTFAGSIVVCHIHNEILRHVHRKKLNDHPDDVEYGAFWMKHRELDNILSSAFMFLPEGFRLPGNLRNPTAVHTNLNLHAGVICLHHAAIDKIETFGLSESLKTLSQTRLRTAAEEIVNIVKLSSHVSPGFKSPLAALSMYCAASVYIYVAGSNSPPGLSNTDMDNLSFVVQAMEAIGRHQVITRSFLQQLCVDIERNGLSEAISLPNLAKYRHAFGWMNSNIPLLAKSYLTNHTDVQTPLPGRLPLGQTEGTFDPTKTPQATWASSHGSADGNTSNKRRRRDSAGPSIPGVAGGEAPILDSDTPGAAIRRANNSGQQPQGFYGSGLLRAAGVASHIHGKPANLPHRTGSAASSHRFGTDSGQMASSTSASEVQSDSLQNSSSGVATAISGESPAEDLSSVSSADRPQGTELLSGVDFDVSSGIDPMALLTNVEDMTWVEGSTEYRS